MSVVAVHPDSASLQFHLDVGADEVTLDLQRTVDLLRREEAVGRDAHTLDQLVALARRHGPTAALLHGDIDGLDRPGGMHAHVH